jgi:hypothetical protein
MTFSASRFYVIFVYGGSRMIMPKDMMFAMAIVTERELSFRQERRELEMDILEVFFGLFGVTFGAVHIHKPLPEMHIGIGVCVAVHTFQLSRFMDILGPGFRVHIQRTNCAIADDLGEVRVPMAVQAFLVRVLVSVGRGVDANHET